MNRKKKRRAVLEYGAGFAALALALALAWFFPDGTDIGRIKGFWGR